MGRRKERDEDAEEIAEEMAANNRRDRIIGKIETRTWRALTTLREAEGLLDSLQFDERLHIESLDAAVTAALRELEAWESYKRAVKAGVLA